MVLVLYISFYLLSVPVFIQYNYNVTSTLRYTSMTKFTLSLYLHYLQTTLMHSLFIYSHVSSVIVL